MRSDYNIASERDELKAEVTRLTAEVERLRRVAEPLTVTDEAEFKEALEELESAVADYQDTPPLDSYGFMPSAVVKRRDSARAAVLRLYRARASASSGVGTTLTTEQAKALLRAPKERDPQFQQWAASPEYDVWLSARATLRRLSGESAACAGQASADPDRP